MIARQLSAASAVRAALISALLALTGCPRPAGPRPLADEPTPTPAPQPATPAPPYVPSKRLELGKIFNGMQYRVDFETEYGTSATRDRVEAESYTAELKVKVKVPKPHQSLAELSQLNPKLPELLPLLPQLIERANVSPYFEELYRLKVEQVKANVKRLDLVLSKHNFYDCETILEIQHPETKRRALLIQADMDVDEDGSDSDRVPVVDGSSLTFQPFTSYRWKKKTDNPNPFLAQREEALAKAREDVGKPGLGTDRTKALKHTISALEAEIYSLKNYSFLVGAVDPFIVLPLSAVGQRSPFAGSTGDYCVVIHDGVLYPAIVGDIGPAYKMGEGSLRICKEINKRSSSINRPVSDLKVTYLVFPGTSEKPFGVPNLTTWRDRCAKYLVELGGTNGELFTWADLTAPPPPPPPSTPAPSVAPATQNPGSAATPTPISPAPTISPARATPASAKPSPKPAQ